MFLVTVVVLILGLVGIRFLIDYLKEYARYRKLLSKLPAPKSYFFIGNLLEFLVAPEIFFKNARKWASDHYSSHLYGLASGPWLAANLIGPDEVEAVTSSTKHITKASLYFFFDRWLGEGLLTSAGKKWQTRRKILTPAFHFSVLQQFVEIFNNETDVMVKRLEKECEKPFVNIMPFITDMALNTINETAMGTKLDMKNKEDESYKKAVYEIGYIVYHRLLRPWLYLRPWYWFSPTNFRELKVLRTLHKFTDSVIAKREETFKEFKVQQDGSIEEDFYSKKKKLAMLDLLLNAKVKDGSIDDGGIRDEVNTFMFEGHDTTSVSMCFTLMLLACHKEAQEKIVEEISQIMGDSQTAHPTYKDFQEMKYMERCIKESLRLYPSVPFIGRITDEDFTSSNGYVIPKKSEIYIHIYDVHRNPKHWPDPDRFDPDRFLPENCQKRHPFAYIPFSAGPRNCIGQKFALLELKAVVYGVLRKFILEPVDTPETLVLVQDVVLRCKDGVKLKLVPRK